MDDEDPAWLVRVLLASSAFKNGLEESASWLTHPLDRKEQWKPKFQHLYNLDICLNNCSWFVCS